MVLQFLALRYLMRNVLWVEAIVWDFPVYNLPEEGAEGENIYRVVILPFLEKLGSHVGGGVRVLHRSLSNISL